MALKDFSILGYHPFAHGETNTPEKGEKSIIGVFGSAMFGDNHGIQVYNPSELVTRKGLEIYDRMRLDEQIKSAMAFKQNTVVAAGWSIQSPEGQEEDWEQTVFIREVFENLGKRKDIHSSRQGISDAVVEILSALEYGFSITEEIWTEIDGKIVLHDLKTRAPHPWEFKIDKHGNVTGLTQFTVPMPISKFLVYAYDGEFQNPYGKSDLESAYRPWWIKSNAYKWLAMLLEKHGVPPIFALYNPNGMDVTAQQDLQSVMKNLQAATVGMIPRAKKDDLDMWSPDLGGNVNKVFLPALKEFDQAISKAILMPGLLGFTSDSSAGSFARSKTHFDVFMLVVEKIRADMERLIQDELVKVLIDLNYVGDEYPIFKFNPITDSMSDEMLAQWANLVDGGVVTKQAEDEAHIRQLIDMPPMSEDSQDGWKEGGPEPSSKKTEADPDNGDAGSDDDLDAELTAHFALARTPNQYEKKVDFAVVARELNALETEALNSMSRVMKEIEFKFIKFLKRNYEPSAVWVRGVELRGMQAWTNQFEEILRGNYELGKDRIKQEIPQAFTERGTVFLNSEALSELKTRALMNSSTVKGRIVVDVQNILLQGVGLGTGIDDMVSEIQKAFLPYIGDPTVLKNGEPLSRFAIENIIRTESTGAFNRGRLIQMRSPEAAPFMQAVEYSAILDTRTTQVCRALDGKVFKLNGNALTDLAPPNHYMCRSIIVPITVDETIDEEDVITPSQIGKAKDLAFEGFTL